MTTYQFMVELILIFKPVFIIAAVVAVLLIINEVRERWL